MPIFFIPRFPFPVSISSFLVLPVPTSFYRRLVTSRHTTHQKPRLLFLFNFVRLLFESGERRLFRSANPFADVEENEVAQNDYQTDKKTYWLLLIGLLRCFEFASLVHDKFSHVHVLPVLLKYSSRPLRLLFESGVYFVQHAWRCGLLGYCSRAASDRADTVALSKMQNIESSITRCLCLRKKYKNIYKFHTIQTFIFTKKTKNGFCHESLT